MMTGAYPAETGIIANEWPDRETGKERDEYYRFTVTMLGGNLILALSPRRLMCSDGRRRTASGNERSFQSHWHFG